MILKDTIKKIESSKEFKNWKKNNPDVYLAHAFTMLDEQEKKYRWQMGYYSTEKDKLTVIETDPAIKIGAEEEVFKKEGLVKPLDMKTLKISVAKAAELCDDVMKKKYSAQTITKRIILVQNLERQMYNVTLVTQAFALVNIKIDASTGEVISDNLQSIMGLGKWEKGEGKKNSSAS